jgi:hypothetical protein
MKRQQINPLSIDVRKFLVVFSFLFIGVINSVNASEAVDNKFRIALGGYSIIRYDSTMSLTDETLGAGISINPVDAFGLKTKQSVFRLDGFYRFNNAHALTYSIYSIRASGNKTLENEFDWLDEDGNIITIPVGANIDTSLNYDIYKVGYLWSFYHTDKVELAAGAGLHITRLTIGLDAGGTYVGNEARDVKTTVPLPVLSFGLTYLVTPKFQWYLKSEFFALKFDEWDGVYTDATFGMEYRAFDHLGFGLGLGSNTLKLTEKTNDYRFDFDNRITGLLLYVAGYF